MPIAKAHEEPWIALEDVHCQDVIIVIGNGRRNLSLRKNFPMAHVGCPLVDHCSCLNSGQI